MKIQHSSNIKYLYWDVTFWGVTNGIAATFTTVFALRMGATDQQVGLISALPALVYMLWFIPAGRLVESRRSIKQTGLAGVFLFRLQYLFIALLPFMPSALRIPALLATIMLAGFPLCVANVALTNVIADVVPPERRPRVVSRRSILTSLMAAIAAALAGKLLDILPMPGNYQVMFLTAFVFGNLSLLALSRITVADTPVKGAFSLQPRQFVRQIAEMLAVVRTTPEFVRFTLAAVALHAGLIFAWPLFSLWWVNGLKASEGLIGLIATANMLVSMGSNLVWARVAEKKGNRFCLLVGFSGIVLMPVVNAFLPSAEYLLLTESFAGLIVPAMSMGLFNTMLEVSPVDHRPTYIAVFSAAVNLPVFLAPILATSIAVPLLGVQYALAASSGLRLIALAIMVALVWKRR
jgi:MFS family permease